MVDVRREVGEHVAWVLEASRSADAWAALVEHHGLRGVNVGPEGAKVVLRAVCGWYVPHAPDDETRAWLGNVPEAVAAQIKPPSAVSSIFANARRTALQTPWAGMTFDRRVNVACPSCGAAQERAREFACRYCGSDLFPKRPEGP